MCAMTTARRPIRERVLAGEVLFGLFLDLDSPASAELAGRAGIPRGVLNVVTGASGMHMSAPRPASPRSRQ